MKSAEDKLKNGLKDRDGKITDLERKVQSEAVSYGKLKGTLFVSTRNFCEFHEFFGRSHNKEIVLLKSLAKDWSKNTEKWPKFT